MLHHQCFINSFKNLLTLSLLPAQKKTNFSGVDLMLKLIKKNQKMKTKEILEVLWFIFTDHTH